LRNNEGFTLIEVVVAFAILLIGILALLQSVNIAFEHNLKNQQRDEVVRVADDIMHAMIAQPFAATFNSVTTVNSKMLNMSRRYTVFRRVTDLPLNPEGQLVSKQYEVRVRWAYKNISSNHAIVKVRGVQ